MSKDKEKLNGERFVKMIRAIGDAIVESVEVGGDQGASGGILYVGLATSFPDLTANAFNQFMDVLVGMGRLSKRGERYYAGQWR